jgi:hypothetical protein
MHCFTVGDRAIPGFWVVRDSYPHIVPPSGCPPLLLEEPLAKFIKSLPSDGDIRYGLEENSPVRTASMQVDITPEHILLRRSTNRSDRQALVHVVTAAGVGGKVCLTANSYDVVQAKNKQVSRVFRPFPDAGVLPVCTTGFVDAAKAGVEFLDIMVQLYPGASFRVCRNGRLEGASPEMYVHWNGHTLNVVLPRKWRYEEARAAGFFDAAV